jgi:hypothetical protein
VLSTLLAVAVRQTRLRPKLNRLKLTTFPLHV